ncbi:unnamed protein product [Clonostachys byssicola]|uniref:Uncharacterized protein n=1 Tax=Clonostachys byssicola TaxID=160290 RepID=A0A9N9Y3G4_9HYPO|nr:unnamed protein product [Clonostachys byssicola]
MSHFTSKNPNVSAEYQLSTYSNIYLGNNDLETTGAATSSNLLASQQYKNEDGFGSTYLVSSEPRRSRTFVNEKTKEVWSDKRLAGIRSFVLFHLPSVAITILLLALYTVRQAWNPPGPSAEMFSVLQFAAKAHEGLILISLSDILLHRIRYGLLGEDGIPLGFLTSAHHLPAPLLYLFSWEFWGTVFYPARNRLSHAITVVLIIVLILLGIGAAPLSAIAMIPRLQWLSVEDVASSEEQMRSNFNVSSPQFITQVRYINPDIYSLELNASRLPATNVGDCLAAAYDFTTPCTSPSLFLQNFWSSITQTPGNLRSQSSVAVTRVGSWAPYRPISFSTFTSFQSHIAYASAPMFFLAHALSWEVPAVYSYSDRDMMIKAHSGNAKFDRWNQPLVVVGCQEVKQNVSITDTLEFEWDDETFGTFNLSLDLQKPVFKPLKGASSYPQSIVLNPAEHIPEVKAPLSAAIILSSASPWATNNYSGAITNLCLVQARWMEADVWINTGSPTGTQFEFDFEFNEGIYKHMKETSTEGNIIKMQKDWVEAVGSNSTDSQISAYLDLYFPSLVFLAFVEETAEITATFLSEILAIYFTDALTTLGKASSYIETSNISSTNRPPGPDDMVINYVHFEHLYAYAFSGGYSVPLAISILCLHVLIVLGHHALLFFTPRPWFSSRWESIGELLALALRSRPPPESRMENVGGGVTTARTWGAPVVVRDLNNGGKLEMVLEEDTGNATGAQLGHHSYAELARPGVKYS